jgi:hypothetical protein
MADGTTGLSVEIKSHSDFFDVANLHRIWRKGIKFQKYHVILKYRNLFCVLQQKKKQMNKVRFKKDN